MDFEDVLTLLEKQGVVGRRSRAKLPRISEPYCFFEMQIKGRPYLVVARGKDHNIAEIFYFSDESNLDYVNYYENRKLVKSLSEEMLDKVLIEDYEPVLDAVGQFTVFLSKESKLPQLENAVVVNILPVPKPKPVSIKPKKNYANSDLRKRNPRNINQSPTQVFSKASPQEPDFAQRWIGKKSGLLVINIQKLEDPSDDSAKQLWQANMNTGDKNIIIRFNLEHNAVMIILKSEQQYYTIYQTDEGNYVRSLYRRDKLIKEELLSPEVYTAFMQPIASALERYANRPVPTYQNGTIADLIKSISPVDAQSIVDHFRR